MAVAAWVAVDLVADGAQVEFGTRAAFTKTAGVEEASDKVSVGWLKKVGCWWRGA